MKPWFMLALGDLQWSWSLAALAAVALLAVLVGVSITRARARLRHANAMRRRTVVVLNVIALIAVALLVAPLGIQRPSLAKVALVTQGADAAPEAVHQYRFGVTDNEELMSLPALRSVGQLGLKHPDLQAVALAGHGLEKEDWRTLPNDLRIAWQSPAITGVINVSWPSILAMGQSLTVKGWLRADTAATALMTVVLSDPGGMRVDTQELRHGDFFELSALPRSVGALPYTLSLEQNGQILAEEPITVHVRAPSAPRILILQSAPSFETRQLSNWAADHEAELIVETTISRDRALVQRINQAGSGPIVIDDTLLAETDLVLLDGRRWLQLDRATRTLLIDAVESGLGLLLWLDNTWADAMDASELENLWGVTLSRDSNDEPRFVIAPEIVSDKPLPVSDWAIEPSTAEPLTLDDQGAVLESWRALGRGRIALSRLRHRHRWATLGEYSLFSRDWARLLGAIGRVSNAPHWLPLELPADVRVGARTLVCAGGAVGEPLFLRITQPSISSSVVDPLVLMPDPLGTPRTCGYIWPRVSGWHELVLANSSGVEKDTVRIFVPLRGVFKSHRFARRQQATREYLLRSASALSRSTQQAALSPWWAWALLLLALIPLWLERRLFELE